MLVSLEVGADSHRVQERFLFTWPWRYRRTWSVRPWPRWLIVTKPLTASLTFEVLVIDPHQVGRSPWDLELQDNAVI